jgi:hypothetical protein
MDENRQAKRFPLQLPVSVKGTAVKGQTETENISSGGVFFFIDSDVKVGSPIELTIRMPKKVLGTPKDVLVKCTGRVVRSMRRNQRRAVAVVIDEYDFQRKESGKPAPKGKK